MKAKAEALERRERDINAAAITIRIALGALGQRILTAFALLATTGMFFWSVIEPTGWRFSTAIAFAVLVLFPLAFFDWLARKPQ